MSVLGRLRRARARSAATEPGAGSGKQATLLSSYPKSGRTWLRFALANYVVLLLDLDVDLDLHSLFTVIPNDDRTAERGLDAYRYWDDERVPLVVASHGTYGDRHAGKEVIFMVRSLPDILVSRYFHVSRQWHHQVGDLKEWLRSSEGGVVHLVEYLNSWASPLRRTRSLVLTYEGMHADPRGTLSHAVAFVGLAVDAAGIREAIARSSFDRMLRLELEGGLPGHCYDAGDPEARRMRKGRVGSYREYLDAEDEAYVRERLRATLSPEARELLGGEGLMPE